MDLRLFPSSQHLKPPSRGRETDRNGSPGRPPDDESSSDKNNRSPFRRRQTSKKDPPPPPPPKPQFVQSEKIQPSRFENVPITLPRHAPPPPHSVGAATWTHIPRPLSDIRETTEPSLSDLARSQSDKQSKRQSSAEHRRHGSNSGTSRPSPKGTLHRTASQNSRQQTPEEFLNLGKSRSGSYPKTQNQGDAESIFGIPSDNVPKRSSSRGSSKARRGTHPGRPSARRAQLSFENCLNEPRRVDIKELPEVPPQRSGSSASRPQRHKPPSPLTSFTVEDILDFPTYKHPRIKLELQIGAPLFVGGGNVEGNIRIILHDAERRRARAGLSESIFIDLVGVEELSGTRRSVFLSSSRELERPHEMMFSTLAEPGSLCPFSSPVCSIPFSINLPLDVGPPPFCSKHARIRYLLAATVWIQDVERPTSVRSSQEIPVISVYDPEKALMSLPSPLTATDTFSIRRSNGLEKITIKAGLHRQVWVSGTSVFVDVGVENECRKPVRKIELQLERAILYYKHAAASTSEKSAGQARIFDSNERTVLCKASFKHGAHGWIEFAAFTTNTRTFDLELPRGHATVRCGKYFEVRFFLNVIASFGHTKSISVQLPIILIHMNSIDVVPNSVARVAAAIEEKRGGQEPHAFDEYQERHLGSTMNVEPDKGSSSDPQRSRSVQGRAFAAPRAQSLERMRTQQGEWDELGRVLERSPRKQAPYVRRNNSTGSVPQNTKNLSKRPPRTHVGQATIFQVGSDTADVLFSRRRPLRKKSLLKPLPPQKHNTKTSLNVPQDGLERSPSPGIAIAPSKSASNKSSSTSSTPRFLRRLASFGSIHYRTPPSNRKARAFPREDAEKLRSCLQHKPGYDNAISKPASAKPISMDFQARRPAPPTPTQNPKRKGVHGQVATLQGFRDGEKETAGRAKGQLGFDGADAGDQDEQRGADGSHTPGAGTGKHGIRNFKDRLEASGFEVRWLKFRGKGKEEREEERSKRDKEVEMEGLGWI